MAKKGFWDYALTSGISTGIGKSKNKGPQAPDFQPYSGYRPPHVNYLRPVEDQITQILMQRSQGQGVGYEPERREKLLQDFDIEQGRVKRDRDSDLQNRISGMGLSRSPAVYDELMGRANRHDEEESNLYRNRVDIEDLARRNEERDVNTGRLQGLNTFNFGQENNVANFDRAIYNDENNARSQAFNDQNTAYGNRQDPLGTALEVAGAAGGLYADYNTGGMYSALKNLSQTQTPGTYQNSIHPSGAPTPYKDTYSDYIKQKSMQKGYKFTNL